MSVRPVLCWRTSCWRTSRDHGVRRRIPAVLYLFHAWNGSARWTALITSPWFVPGAIVLAAVLLAAALVEVSTRLDNDTLARFPRLFGAGAEGSRGMLSTIAGSTITVAGVTFSITIAAMAQASAQYTPRILRTFMSDRANQVVLGTFVGIFAYCLVVLRTIRGGNGESLFIPSVAVLSGFLLAIVGVGVLIYFIHHIASALQASTIVARVSEETWDVIDRLFPDELGHGYEDEHAGPRDDAAELTRLAHAAWHAVPAPRTGYIQHVLGDALIALAQEHDAVLRMERAVGDFVVEGAPLVSMTVAEAALRRSIDSAFVIRPYRTVDQDPAFGVRQLVDIALKALSPGVNDTTTAVTCVDYLGSILARLAARRLPDPVRVDEAGQIRVIVRSRTFTGMVAVACDEIRRSATDNVRVLEHLVAALEAAGASTTDAGRRRDLLEQLDLIAAAAERGIPAPNDRAALGRVVEAARHALAGSPRPDPALPATT